jgi:flagellar biosynthesis/type III secretory pathway protein FliH
MGNPFSTVITGLLCAALFAPAVAATADAQWRRAEERGYGSGRARDDYERGYRTGLQQGAEDARRSRGFDLGRNPFFGARDDFRRGFAEGYRAGFDRASIRQSRGNGRNNGIGRRAPTRFNEPAAARGFSDGYEDGLNDGRRNDRYDPVGSRDYRDGDNGYFGSYGPRDAYRNNYRAGFRQGYEEGYRDGVRDRR